MANIKSAKKRIRVIDKKTARNARIKGHMKQAEKKLMQAAAKGTLNKKAASRKVSRLAKRFNAAKAAK